MLTNQGQKIPMKEWKNRLALAPDETINHAFDNTTQLAMSIESDNRALPRRHCKHRLPFFKHPRLRDEFHVDEFYPSVSSAQNHTCAETFTGKETCYWYFYPMNKESIHCVLYRIS